MENDVISSPYEPGSPYKLITAAVALEENITSEDVAGDFTVMVFMLLQIEKLAVGHKVIKALKH